MSKSSHHSEDTLSDRKKKAATASELAELRSLIVGTTNQRVDRIEDQLDDPEQRAGDISRILPRAVSLSSARNGRLANALQPITEHAIRASIKKDRQIFVDVLFPVMGPAIRKAIAATIQGLIQNFNQILEHSFSIRGLRWRLEALRTRRPFAEVVLLNTLVYQVEQVFLIHRDSGLLVDHLVAKTAASQNPDLVSGMLTAIKDFVQDSFGAAQEDTLDTFQVGRRKVWIEHGTYAMLALVIGGNPSIHLREMMRDALDEIHANQSENLKSYNGEAFATEDIRPALTGLLQVQFKSQEKKRSWGAWFVIGLCILLMGWGIFHWTIQQRRWSRLVDKLHRQPGIVVTEIKKQDGKRHLYGLRDPYAPPSSQLLEGSGIPSKSVAFHWEAYQSTFPEYARQRSKKLFKPPASVDLAFDSGTLRATGAALGRWIEDTRRMARIVPWIDQYDDYDVVNIDAHLQKPDTVVLTLTGDTLHATGSARRKWIAQARTAAKSIAGITSYKDGQLVDADAQEWDTLGRIVNDAVFYFESGSTVLMPGQGNSLQLFITTVRQLAALSESLDRPTQVDIIGHADGTGGENRNRVLSRNRAQTFADLLVAGRIEATFLTVHAAGSQELIQPEINADKRAFNRRVVFVVRPVTR